MIFRRKIFLVVFLVGLVPASVILTITAILLNSAIKRIGAVGLDQSLQSASRLTADSESALGSLLSGALNREIPWGNESRIHQWMRQNHIDLVFEIEKGRPARYYVDDTGIDSTAIAANLPVVPGPSRVVVDESLFICYSVADSFYVRGCAVLMPAGFLQDGRNLAEAISVAASLEIYKEFSLELLGVVTALLVIIVLITGYFISSIISGRLVKPLAKLTEGARKIGSGDLDFRLGFSGDDEFSRLGRSFDKMAEEIRENQSKLMESQRLAAWREVARRIAHEIRNPLTPITVELYRLRQMLAKSGISESEESIKLADNIKAQLQVLQDLSSQFTLFAREPELKRTRCCLMDIVNEVVSLHLNIENVNITVDISAGIPDLYLDPRMTGRLLTNLIKNSIEASPEGVAIEISGRSEGDKILLKVRDDGPGFPVEKLDRIEQPYFTTKGSGTGLGLAISKKIVEEHGGMIRFYNDKGAVAEIILPVN